MEIGKQIKKYRAEMGMSQDELAERIFVSRQTISNWENDKSYPDLKSIVLLSSLFGVSLDILIKGDLEKMKEKIKSEDMKSFRRDSNIFSVLLLSMLILPVPLIRFFGYIGIGVWVLLAVVAIVFALRIEKLKKTFDIQTYKEIIAFTECKNLSDIERNREYGKRPYQKIFLAIGAALLAIVITAIMYYVLF